MFKRRGTKKRVKRDNIPSESQGTTFLCDDDDKKI